MRSTIIILVIPFVFLSGNRGFAQIHNISIYEFKTKLKITKLLYQRPKNFIEIDSNVNNSVQYYDYSLRHNKLDIEIRYCIHAYDSIAKTIHMKVPDLKKHLFRNTVVNLTSGKRSDFIEYPEQIVKKEFGADWGATSSVELNSEFSRSYKYCMIMTFHKNDVGDIYIYYLCNDVDTTFSLIKDLDTNMFYTLKWPIIKE